MRRKVGAMLMLVERSRWDPCYLWKEKSCTSHHAAPPPSPAALLSTDSPLLYSQSSAAGPDLPACPSKACPREAKRMDGFHLAKVLGSNWGGDRSPSYSCFSPQEHTAHADCLWASSCGLQPTLGRGTSTGRAVSPEGQRVRKQLHYLCAVTSSANHSACGSPVLCTKINGRKHGAEKRPLH